jgi:outer membrane lipoprotein-sorting protein
MLAFTLAAGGRAEEPGSDAASYELVALMDQFASSGTVRANFKETRRISLLTDTIETEGVLYFAPPDRLARYTTRPGNSRVVVHGGRAALRDETGTRSFDFGSNEIAQSLIENLMVVLRGDLPGLRERYTLAFTSDGQSWLLDLKPRSKTVAAIIERIRFSGTGWTLKTMETRETNDDVSLLVFSRIETQLVLPQQEFERIFSLNDDDATSFFRSIPSRNPRALANP